MIQNALTFVVLNLLTAISAGAVSKAPAISCKITNRDLKTGGATVLLPKVTKSITTDKDFEFKTYLVDTKQKKWTVQLLGSASSNSDREIELAWSIRDSSGTISDIETVSTSVPLLNGQQTSLNVNWKGNLLKASCKLSDQL